MVIKIKMRPVTQYRPLTVYRPHNLRNNGTVRVIIKEIIWQNLFIIGRVANLIKVYSTHRSSPIKRCEADQEKTERGAVIV